jgi:hypothetical protein
MRSACGTPQHDGVPPSIPALNARHFRPRSQNPQPLLHSATPLVRAFVRVSGFTTSKPSPSPVVGRPKFLPLTPPFEAPSQEVLLQNNIAATAISPKIASRFPARPATLFFCRSRGFLPLPQPYPMRGQEALIDTPLNHNKIVE